MTVTSEKRSESTEGGRPVRDNPVVLPAVAFATQRLCPYLVADGSEWRSASPSRDHRCGAVAPPVPLAVDKQRRLCVTNRHVSCPTFLAATAQPGRANAHTATPDPAAHGSRRNARPGGDTVTRWSIGRTAPVLLDRGRVPARVVSLVRVPSPQLFLVVVVAVAFIAIAATRFSGAGSAPLGSAAPGASQVPPAVVAVAPSAESPVAPSVAPSEAPAQTPTATAAPTLPATANSTRTYRVKRGDTLYVLARRFGTTVSTLQRLNGLGRSTTLHAGDVLKLP